MAPSNRFYFVQSILFLFSTFAFTPANISQTLIDDFESGNLNNWKIIKGNAGIFNHPSFPSLVAQLGVPDMDDAETQIFHRSFSDNFGTYEMQCYADGSFSDINFFFHYQDSANYYQVSFKPLTTDNPELILFKMVDGNYTLIDRTAPIVGLNELFILKVVRTCPGEINVYINEDLQIATVDRDIKNAGTIGLGAWAESTYFDDLTFQPTEPAFLFHLSDTICQTERYYVGDTSYALAGFYADTLQTSQGCDSIIHLNLSVTPAYLVYLRDTICAGEYTFLGTDTIRTGGIHTRTLLSFAGCDSIVELSLLVIDPLALNLGVDFNICFKEIPGVELKIDGFESYLWSNGSTGSSLLIESPGTFWLEGSDGICAARDTIVVDNVCDAELYIPNAFSPNNDGINDEFKVVATNLLNSFELKIFNRWGDFIFQTSNPNSGWDGTWNNEKQDAGVYVWVVQTENGIRKGDVTLIR